MTCKTADSSDTTVAAIVTVEPDLANNNTDLPVTFGEEISTTHSLNLPTHHSKKQLFPSTTGLIIESCLASQSGMSSIYIYTYVSY